MEDPWSPVKEAGHLTDRIVSRIEALIANEQLTDGERLPAEREMARMLGVSRPALREAVKTLEARGRLVVRHGQGVFVSQNALASMQDHLASLEVSLGELFAMREVLEVAAAGWAAEAASDEEIGALRELLEAERLARTPPVDFDHVGKLDAAFHLRIVELAGNRFLSQTLGVLQGMLAAGMETTLAIPGRIEASSKDHGQLLEAIAARDSEAARNAALRHITAARDAALLRVRSESGKVSPGTVVGANEPATA